MKIISHINVTGRVQGVGYRAFVQRAALTQGVEGWVRNCRDGSVEAVLAGAADRVAMVVEACRKGPYAARVENIDVRQGAAEELDARLPGEAFSELPTV